MSVIKLAGNYVMRVMELRHLIIVESIEYLQRIKSEGLHRSGTFWLGVRGSLGGGGGGLSSRASHVALMFSPQSRFEVQCCW